MKTADKVGQLAERYVRLQGPNDGEHFLVDREKMWDWLFDFGLQVRRRTLREERNRNRVVARMFKPEEA